MLSRRLRRSVHFLNLPEKKVCEWLTPGLAISSVQGRVGATVIPGATQAFNPLTGKWEKYPLNVVGNTNGGTWHCVISRLSKKKEATYDFLAFMANKKNAFFNSTRGWTGVQPAMKYEYFPPVGSGSVVDGKTRAGTKLMRLELGIFIVSSLEKGALQPRISHAREVIHLEA